jgi:DNA-binding response OmpR family regulator
MSEPNQAVVLLVDADPAVHDLVSRAITTECAFLGARTAELALRLAVKRAPAVVILDDQLPETTPDQLFAEIKAQCPGTRAILVTSSRDPDHTAKLATMGPVLTKPLDEERLRVAVRAVLRLHAMSAGVERMKTGEFPALPNLHRSAPTRREGPK